MSYRLWSVAAALACAACQVGDPLVDKLEPGDGDLVIMCRVPPPCEPPFPVETPSHGAEPVALEECAKSCSPEALDGGQCPQDTEAALPISAMCRELTFKASEQLPEIELNDIDWTDVNLSLQAEHQLRVVVTGGKLRRVFFELEGPIDLRIERTEPFEDVRIRGSSSEAGTPSLELTKLEAQTLSIGTDAAAFAGELTLRALHLTDTDVHAASLSVEGARIEQSSLRAESLALADITLRRALVDGQMVRMTYFNAEDTSLHLCGDARVVDGRFTRGGVSSCADSHPKIYHCNFGSSSLDGPFELSEVSLAGVTLGLSDKTHITAYNTRVESTQLCSNVEQLALGVGSQLKCSGCADELADEQTQPACVFDASEGTLLNNFCPAWRMLDALPACEQDLPERPDRVR